MLTFIDSFLNKITMYRLVLYVVGGLLGVAVVLGALNLLHQSPIAIIFSTLILLVVCYAANALFAWAWKAPTNIESVLITAGILALIFTPAKTTADIWTLVWAGVIAMASKYILAFRKKHVFNPAALAAVFTALVLNQYASWWVGTASLFPFVLVGGLLVARKIRRFDLVLSFTAVALVLLYVFSPFWSQPLTLLTRIALDSPIAFFALIMLTEPFTTPSTRGLRIAYGALVAVLYVPTTHFGALSLSPEEALVVGNVFSWLVSPKEKFILTLKRKVAMGGNQQDLVFTSDRKIPSRAGQFMEWTLAHPKPDNRGIRRYFTLASSPAEDEVHLGVKFYEPSSTFKKHLAELPVGGSIVVGQLAGDFSLPKADHHKYVFLAGGIGVTPFRSIVQDLMMKREKRDIVMFYSNKVESEIVYRDVFDAAEKEIGLRMVYALTGPGDIPDAWNGHRGFIDMDLVKKEVPDFKDRLFYISGPHGMVESFQKTLRGLGIPPQHIHTDYFPGFA